MNSTRALLRMIMPLLALALVAPEVPAQALLPAVHLLMPAEESLMTPGTEVIARPDTRYGAGVRTVEYLFRTADGREIDLGDASLEHRQAFGPHCAARLCEVPGEFWGSLDALRSIPEGWGTLSVRLPGTRLDQDAVRVYWDGTPPVARFASPAYADGVKPVYPVVLGVPDENVALVKVSFKLFNGPNRNIPPLEQHMTGAFLTSGGHASCVPTAVAANMKWVDQTGQADVVPTGLSDIQLVTEIGTRMGTMGGGTSGAGSYYGTSDWLADQDFDPEFPSWDSDLDQEYNPAGLHPNVLAGYMSQGYAVNLGIHNLAGDAGFGHYVALDNINVQANGSAWIRVMDPNIEPPGSPTGAYRTFLMKPDGTILWNAAAIGYGNPATGKMRIDELLAFGDFDDPIPFPSEGGSGEGAGDGSQIQGVLLPDGHTWVGTFVPPAGQSGPWVLTAEVTDTAGMTQLSHQVIGVRS